MELIRQRQQKAYEEQALRHAEEALRRAEEKKAVCFLVFIKNIGLIF